MREDRSNAAVQIGRAVFFPRPDERFGPEARGAFDHLFRSKEGIRHRLRFFLAGKSDPNILFFHGNGETARDYDPLADIYRSLPASLIAAEYRGYGPSSGTPSLETMLTDAHIALDEMRKQLTEKGHTGPVVLMGRSLGSAPAIELASSRGKEVSGLIIESGFANVIPLLELLGAPVKTLGFTEQQGPRNLEKMAGISVPTLILHAEQDRIIPIGEAELLYQANKDPQKAFLRVPNAGHNDIQFAAGEAYFARIRDLLKRITGATRIP